MKFDIFNGNKSYSNNALLSGDREATVRQTPEEHERLLDVTTTDSGMLAQKLQYTQPELVPMLMAQAREEADQREHESPHWWYDEDPRRPITQSSSWVGNTDYNPETGVATIALKNRTIARVMTPDQQADMVNADSIGKYFHRNLRG